MHLAPSQEKDPSRDTDRWTFVVRSCFANWAILCACDLLWMKDKRNMHNHTQSSIANNTSNCWVVAGGTGPAEGSGTAASFEGPMKRGPPNRVPATGNIMRGASCVGSTFDMCIAAETPFLRLHRGRTIRRAHLPQPHTTSPLPSESKPVIQTASMAFFAAVRANKNALAGGASVVGAGVGLVGPSIVSTLSKYNCMRQHTSDA